MVFFKKKGEIFVAAQFIALVLCYDAVGAIHCASTDPFPLLPMPVWHRASPKQSVAHSDHYLTYAG